MVEREGVKVSIIRVNLLAATAASVLMFGAALPASADTIFDAMAKAYTNNPDLNVARAGLRATDEGVTIAKAGWRPQISSFAQASRTVIDNVGPLNAFSAPTVDKNASTAKQIGITITQQIFDGFQTLNNVRAAEASVYAQRAQLKATEIQTLLAAAQSYANIARDQEIVSIRKQNMAFLNEQVSAANARLEVGEGTKTDVSLALAQLAQAKALLANAIFQLKQSQSVYVQIVGEAPRGIRQPSPIVRQLPRDLDTAVATGLREHPSVIATEHAIDAAGYQVKSAEGAMLPGVVIQGQLANNSGTPGLSSVYQYTSSSITARLNVPIYQGGAEYGQIRQAKEKLGEQRIQLDSVRAQIQQTIVASMAQYEASVAVISANQAQLKAAIDARDGVVEERKVGQATTLDVLDSQASVLNAKESLATSQHDAVVASFSIVAAIGELTIENENLKVARYDPDIHYKAVKDAWIGLRTVDGR
jgi:outer membrane protein